MQVKRYKNEYIIRLPIDEAGLESTWDSFKEQIKERRLKYNFECNMKSFNMLHSKVKSLKKKKLITSWSYDMEEIKPNLFKVSLILCYNRGNI